MEKYQIILDPSVTEFEGLPIERKSSTRLFTTSISLLILACLFVYAVALFFKLPRKDHVPFDSLRIYQTSQINADRMYPLDDVELRKRGFKVGPISSDYSKDDKTAKLMEESANIKIESKTTYQVNI